MTEPPHTASLDPLRAGTPLPFQQVLFPLGFPAHIKSNERAVIRTAERSWAAFQPRFRENPIEVRVLVSNVASASRPGIPIFRAQSNLLAIVADAYNFASCDLSAGRGFACLSTAAIKNYEYFRFNFLEAMVYSLLDTQHCVALHAACIERNGHGFLLLGDSGAGKSTLSYACARRGWTYISDDATFIVRSGKARIAVGNSQTFRFRPAVSSLFPELTGPVKLRNGKPTIEIRTETLRGLRIGHECSIDFIIFLNRFVVGNAAPQLDVVRPEDAFRRLLQNPWPADLAIHEERSSTLDSLIKATLLTLTYTTVDQGSELLDGLASAGKT